MEKEHSLAVGTVIDEKYRIDGSLSDAGGMGEVYRATQIAIGRKVAVKVLRPELSQHPQMLERFKQEARIAGSLGHPHICEVTDFGELENRSSYLVMPLLNGASLADMLKEYGTLSLARVIDIACQVLSALNAAHAEKIVHRDLKPDNIFVTALGDGRDFVKLLDFGISKILHQDQSEGLTVTGTTLGTPQYMSPEQARGSKDINALTDIYAMGVILYHAVTGVRPFDGFSYNEIIAKILMDPYRPPRELISDIPRRFEQVIFKAMSRNPAERFQSAVEMSEALQRSTDATFSDISVPLIRTQQETAVESSAPFAQMQQTDRSVENDAASEKDESSSRTTIRSPKPEASLVGERTPQGTVQTETAIRTTDVPDYVRAERRRKIIIGTIAALLIVGGLVAFVLLGRSPEAPATVPVTSSPVVSGPPPAATAEPTKLDPKAEPTLPVTKVGEKDELKSSAASPVKGTESQEGVAPTNEETARENNRAIKRKSPRRHQKAEERIQDLVDVTARVLDNEKKEPAENLASPTPNTKGRYGAEAPDEF